MYTTPTTTKERHDTRYNPGIEPFMTRQYTQNIPCDSPSTHGLRLHTIIIGSW